MAMMTNSVHKQTLINVGLYIVVPFFYIYSVFHKTFNKGFLKFV